MKRLTIFSTILGLMMFGSAISRTAFPRFFSSHPHGSSPGKIPQKVRASLDKQWMDYDITENGIRGMRIHLKFTVYELKDSVADVAIYFEYDDERGGRIKDKNQKYYSASGEVAVYKELTPKYDPALYEDMQIFMPYDELDLKGSTTKYNLKMDVDIIRTGGGLIQHLNFYKFDFTKPVDASTNTGTTPNVTFDKIWVDYDVLDGGKKGMRIHAKFTAYNMKDMDGYMALYFEMKDGTKLLTNNTPYRSKEGQVASYTTIKPGYDEAVFSNLEAFMPYTEFNLVSGKYDLRFRASIIKKDGTLVKSLTTQEFTFTQ